MKPAIGTSGRQLGGRHRWVRLVAVSGIALVLSSVAGAQSGDSSAPRSKGEPAALSGVRIASLTDSEVHAGLQERLRPGLAPAVLTKMALAFPLAVRLAGQSSGCQSLFAKFGARGEELLARTIYVPATADQERRLCRRGVKAVTEVGSPVTRLCAEFSELPRARAALALIHEALHFAGLPEQPWSADAMTSTEINEMVRGNCRF
jgi:hypothetical protein